MLAEARELQSCGAWWCASPSRRGASCVTVLGDQSDGDGLRDALPHPKLKKSVMSSASKIKKPDRQLSNTASGTVPRPWTGLI